MQAGSQTLPAQADLRRLESLGESFARISSHSVWPTQDKDMDKNGCMVDKIGHFPNLVEITGNTRVFCGQNRAC